MSSSSSAFGVVNFLDSNEIEVMPMNWAYTENGILRCFWPNVKKVENFLSAVRMQLQPVKSLWSNHPIRIFHEFETFEEEASQVEHFENHSDFSEAESAPKSPAFKSRSGRPIKRPRSDFNNGSTVHAKTVGKSTNLVPAFPEFASTSSSLEHTETPHLLFPNSSDSGSNIGSFKNSSVDPFDEQTSTSVIFTNGCSEKWEDFWTKFSGFEAMCVRNFATIQANQNALVRMMESVVHNAAATTISPRALQPTQNFGFPFKTREKLLEFNSKLVNDDSFKAACIVYLGSIGGCDLTTTVYEVLKKLLTYELAYTYNFSGTNGKSCFASLNLVDLIFDVVKINPRTATETMTAVRKKIQSWVQHAGDHLPKSLKKGGRAMTLDLSDSVAANSSAENGINLIAGTSI